MRNKTNLYIKINEKDNLVETRGMMFKEFMKWCEYKPKNILILKGYPYNCNWCTELGLEYVNSDDIEKFLEEDVYSYGDFCWIDFESEDYLKLVSNEELAEILYLSHKMIPLNEFRFKSLKNRYAYLSHDDDYFAKVYMPSTEEYKEFIQYKILTELKGRKRSIEKIPDEIIDKLYELFKKGAVIDFENAYTTGVRILPIGKFAGSDEIHMETDRLREILRCGIHLNYDTRTRKWEVL